MKLFLAALCVLALLSCSTIQPRQAGVSLELISWNPSTNEAILELRNGTSKDISFLVQLFTFSATPETTSDELPSAPGNHITVYPTGKLRAQRVKRLTTSNAESGKHVGVYVKEQHDHAYTIVWSAATS
jgi:P pilus assembly chaperone PapD